MLWILTPVSNTWTWKNVILTDFVERNTPDIFNKERIVHGIFNIGLVLHRAIVYVCASEDQVDGCVLSEHFNPGVDSVHLWSCTYRGQLSRVGLLYI